MMRPVCPSSNRLKIVHKFINRVQIHSRKSSTSKSKVESNAMSALCQQQLYAVFQLVDNGGKGYISSDDLIRVSSADSNEGGIAEVLQLLRLGDRYGHGQGEGILLKPMEQVVYAAKVSSEITYRKFG